MSPSNTRVFVDGERIAKSSILGCDMDSEGVDFIWTLGQVGGAKKRKASLSTYNVELPIGSFGYNIERTSDGKCRVTSASGNNGEGDLQYGDIITAVNRITLASVDGGVSGWNALFQCLDGVTKQLIVEREGMCMLYFN